MHCGKYRHVFVLSACIVSEFGAAHKRLEHLKRGGFSTFVPFGHVRIEHDPSAFKHCGIHLKRVVLSDTGTIVLFGVGFVNDSKTAHHIYEQFSVRHVDHIPFRFRSGTVS